MQTLREWMARLWGSLVGGRRDADLEEELRLHAELADEDQTRRRQHSAARARATGTMRAGGLTQAMDAVRDQRGLPWLDDLGRDVRYAARGLRRRPGFTLVVLLTLGIGIGANTAVFSVVNSVLLEPLPYPEADALVAVWHSAPGAPGLASVSGDLRLSASMYFTYADQNATFQHLGLWYAGSASVTGLAEPEQVRTLPVTDGLLQALGVQPMLGRWLSDADQTPGAAQVVMLGYGYWQRRFGGDPTVVGRSLTVDARPRDIVGVMPPGFRVVDADPDLILPIAFDRSRLLLPGFGFQAVGRLKPGRTIADANADIARLVPVWMQSWPAAAGVDPRVYESWRITPAIRPLHRDVVGNVVNVLWILMATIGAVMLIVCANVANLLLLRTEGRQQELAVRAALGAGRGRIVRELLVESLLLALAGGVFGLVLASFGLRFLVTNAPANLPRLDEITLDGRALFFTLFVSLLAGLVFGWLPALRHADGRIATGLRSGGRTSSHGKERIRTRNTLVVVQVALALVLLVGSGLMIRTFQALRGVEPGFTGAHELQAVRLAIPASLVPEPDRVTRIQRDIVERLSEIASVRSVAFASEAPMEGLPTDWDAIRAEHQAIPDGEIPPLRVFKAVSPGFFQTMGTRLVAGRDVTWADIEGLRPGILVSENLARELWGGATDALGKRVQTLNDAPWREVIGVVQDVHENGAHEQPPKIVYWPSTSESPYRAGAIDVTRTLTLVIRSERAGLESFLAEVRQRIWAVNASIPVASVRTMQEVYDRSMARTSFALVMLAIAAAMALVLSIVGISGIVSYTVSQRTREIGIRVTLGAQHRDVRRMFISQGLALTGMGVAIGMAAAVAITRWMSSLLFGISALDPATFVAAPLALALVATLASYLPARRAAAVDPVDALKLE